MVASKSVNWNSPGEISVAAPRAVQLVDAIAAFVVAMAVKLVPGVLTKLNWNSPPGNLVGLIMTTCVEPGEMSRILETLGIPLTNIVARA